MSKPRKYTGEQIVCILQKHRGGVTGTEISRRQGGSHDTFYLWKRRDTGLGKVELQGLKALEGEHRRLKPAVSAVQFSLSARNHRHNLVRAVALPSRDRATGICSETTSPSCVTM